MLWAPYLGNMVSSTNNLKLKRTKPSKKAKKEYALFAPPLLPFPYVFSTVTQFHPKEVAKV